MDLEAHIGARIAAVIPRGASVCAGLSGGVDSALLLALLARAAPAHPFRLSAVHVHHGLSPNADAWARFCEAFCAARGVPLAVEHVRIERSAPEGLEAAARRARYAVFASRREDILALAHHLDDQAETALLQLLRGTGLKGVAAMPEVRALPGSGARIFRPLLGVGRAAIVARARLDGVEWIEDESNLAPAHDRNFLRHAIAPRLDERFPAWRKSLARFARHAASAGELLREAALADGLPAHPGEPLRVDRELSAARRANLLREFLALNAIALPGEARLAEMARQLFDAREDARVRLVHAGAAIVRYRGGASIERHARPRGPWRVAWNGERLVELGDGRGAVRFEPAHGEGLDAARARDPGWHFAGRGGGERIRIHARGPTRTLKNLFQENGVPPWRREALPLLFHGSALVWVPGIAVAAEYACRPGARGIVPHWLEGA